MARIAGVNLPKGKSIHIALRYIYGIGPTNARQICDYCKISQTRKIDDLTEEELNKIRDRITTNYPVEGDLRREISMNIKRLVDIGSYRGMRHKRGLPTRGQRTKTNARTRKGPRKSIIASKK